jgi:ABC-type transport system substrate-binding protein
MGTRCHRDALYRREFATEGHFNATGYSNPELDRILEAAQCADHDEMDAHYAAADEIIREDMPVNVLCETKTVVGARRGVDNFEAHPLGYWNLQDVVVRE